MNEVWEVLWSGSFPEITARGTADRWVSIREPVRGCFVWSWCAYGARRWRAADATSGRS